MKVIPVINEIDFSEVLKKIKKFEPYFDWAQIDISDGSLSDRKASFGYKEISSLKTNLNLEIHLMIEDPEDTLEDWLKINKVKRVIIHSEEIKDFNKIIELRDKYKKEVGLALKLETDWEEVKKYFSEINFFLLLGVKPGGSGQKFDTSVLDKIKGLKDSYPNSIISIDGGINKETAKLVKEAGADIVYSSSFLFDSPDIEEAITLLTFDH